MKKLKNLKAKTLTFGNYIVTIEYQKDIYDIYLHNEDYGFKEYMFGLPTYEVKDEQELVEIIEANIVDYIQLYNKMIEKLEIGA